MTFTSHKICLIFQEYRALHNIGNTEKTFDHELLHKLNTMYVKKPSRLLVMTRASEPLYLFKDGSLMEFDVLPVSNDEIVDTDGAGDAFVAGFLAQYVKRKDIPDCVKCGLWTSKEIIQQHGCNFDQNKVYVDYLLFLATEKDYIMILILSQLFVSSFALYRTLEERAQ